VRHGATTRNDRIGGISGAPLTRVIRYEPAQKN
jgi:hypothetical protein